MRALINAAISAFDVYVLGLDPNMTTEERINSDELAQRLRKETCGDRQGLR